MVGTIEKILRRRFGPPTTTDYQGFVARTWNVLQAQLHFEKMQVSLDMRPRMTWVNE